MKIGTAPHFHLTYCTNIHPGEDWQQVFANLHHYLPPLKARIAPDAPFGVGLRLGDRASRELLAEDNLAQFQTWLAQHSLYVFTLNGFPYGGFHHQVVKDRVYAPDWTERSRLAYTFRLARILTHLLPAGMDGSISTLPLSYKPWHVGTQRCRVLTESSVNLALMVAELERLRQETGKLLHVDLEPEPDGLLENAAEVVNFFQDWLLPIGGGYLAERNSLSRSTAETMLLEHINVCYDTCHFAVEYEEPAAVLNRFSQVGIKIGKIQLSAAIKVTLPPPGQRSLVLNRLRPFAESTYLHQVIERFADGTLCHYRDLVAALSSLEQSPAEELRTHFHVPIFIHDYHILQSTQDHLVELLQLLLAQPVCQHLEIETYTWDVLPTDMKLDLSNSIEREYQWVLEQMMAKNRQRPATLVSVANQQSAINN
ncbi:MAG: metabolite traffic protein EboE [Cyanophyceae cyanobacterium]